MPRLRPALLLVALALPCAAAAAPSPSPTSPPKDDDSVLGTVQVTGAAGVALVYPKLAIVPLLTKSDADTLSQLVAARDFELSGEYDVVSTPLPDGPFLPAEALDYEALKKKSIEVVVRIWSDAPAAGAGAASGAGVAASAAGVTLHGDLHFTTDKLPKDDPTWKAAGRSSCSPWASAEAPT